MSASFSGLAVHTTYGKITTFEIRSIVTESATKMIETEKFGATTVQEYFRRNYDIELK